MACGARPPPLMATAHPELYTSILLIFQTSPNATTASSDAAIAAAVAHHHHYHHSRVDAQVNPSAEFRLPVFGHDLYSNINNGHNGVLVLAQGFIDLTEIRVETRTTVLLHHTPADRR
ncbi:hypothetical protein Pmani_011265 [Petrolisthes manimaculis]|uniref:Uncharacterized protein n=1 Tax=Petrolisthes manimaculis TaxID=1843537 RepID=A0AAE1Q395_9EUCA|nr:hypothetical protein Pmani_011265 [Petrolisthes manimaculis]